MVEAIDWIWEDSWNLKRGRVKIEEFRNYAKNRTINVAKNQVKILQPARISADGTLAPAPDHRVPLNSHPKRMGFSCPRHSPDEGFDWPKKQFTKVENSS